MSSIYAISVPKWGIEMAEGTVSEWLKDVGDPIEKGDEVYEMESDKAVNAWEAPVAGVLRRKLAESGDVLPVGALMGVIADADTDDAEIDAFIDNHREETAGGEIPESTAAEPIATTQPETAAVAQQPASSTASNAQGTPQSLVSEEDDSACLATPRARRFAQNLGINLNRIRGTGRRGRISIADIRVAVTEAGGRVSEPPPASRADVEALKLSDMRRTIGRRLQKSKQTAPHYRTTMDIRLDNLLGIRAQLNAAEPAEKISVNDLVVKAVAAALIKVPELNVQYDEDAGTIRRFRDADISIAVALEDGLITPIVRSANRKSVLEIAEETRTLIDKAKTGSLASEEFQGGTFTISNLGMYGIRDFDAIINPPQCAILAVGAGEQRPVVAAGEMTVATLMTVTLCSDHRIIDGAQAARFLNALKDIIENQSL